MSDVISITIKEVNTILKNTFVHVPGVSKCAEENIWRNDILSWEDFISNHSKIYLSTKKRDLIFNHIEQSIKALKNKDFSFFINDLPSNMHWRAYKDLKDNCCFLDIETTGLDRCRDRITTIGLYDGKKSKVFVQGKNLDDFSQEIKKYPMIITFNGRCFDIPFIKEKFPSIDFNKFHIDLRFAMKNLGYSGGLKFIEKQIGLEREDDLKEVDGYEAVRLWRRYERGDKSALDLLIKYNIADVENLKTMMNFAFERLKEKEFYSKIG
jgi:uncharacterized protein